MFNNIIDAEKWIESVKRFGDKLDLSRMELACEMLNHPELSFKTIHVGGTNGKGSTVTYLKNILLEQGYNIGTYTSPYVVRFNERITYNGNDITDDEFLKYINEVYKLQQEYFKKYNDIITFFELITLISFMYFRDLPIDFVIYEVGLGGTLDATNVIVPEISVITNISYDHMNVLGNTLESIALNKLGIVKEGIPLVTSVDQDELEDLFVNYTNKLHSDLYYSNSFDIANINYSEQSSFDIDGETYSINMLGTHQVTNAALAIKVIEILNQEKQIDVPASTIRNGLLKASWPGRLERFGNVIIDGAHNIGGMNALKDSITTLFKDKYIKAVFTVMADKETFDIIQVLDSFVDEVYYTEFDCERCEKAINLFSLSSHPNKHLDTDVVELVKKLKDVKENELLLITGSLYFISLVRKLLK